ncbi:S1C family serine protease [Streptomyces sp. NPDC001709]
MKYRAFIIGMVTVALAACGGGNGAGKMTPKQVFDRASPATVELHGNSGGEESGGTGFIYDAGKGLILTNAHVVQGLTTLKARLNDQSDVPVRVLGINPCEDVAVLTFTQPQSNLKQIPLGDSSTVQSADDVTALGYPASYSDPTHEKIVFTSGVVQTPDVAASPDDSLPKYSSTIQHSATINYGNSGGPLLNDKGQVVGINTLTNLGTGEQPVQGQFYAISINHVKPLLSTLASGKDENNAGWILYPVSQLKMTDTFKSLDLGGSADAEKAQQLIDKNKINGMFVWSVDENSPAEKANLGTGDLIADIKGTPVSTMAQVCDILQSAPPGETLKTEGVYIVSNQPQQPFGQAWEADLVIK